MNLSASKRREMVIEASRFGVAEIVALRANGTELTAAARDELLAKCMSGAYCELELELLSYEQETGKRNRKFIRVRDGAMAAFARSAKGRPFLRDHLQGDALARGGTITESQSEKLGDGKYVVRQKVKLTAPWAVELALRGLLDSLSVGIHPGEGAVNCSYCGTEVFDACWHMRGEEIETDDGQKVVIEWVFDQPEIVETSAVSVPAVTSARVEAIRAALSAHNRGSEPLEMTEMNKLLSLLGLAATAGVDEVFKAVEALKQEIGADKAELGIVKAELAVAKGELATFQADKRKTDEDRFIGDALGSGRIAAGDEPTWRQLFQLSAERARALMSERQPGTATPVGAPRQSANPPKTDPTNPTMLSAVDQEIQKYGGDPNKVRASLFAQGFSAAQVDKMLARTAGVKGA